MLDIIDRLEMIKRDFHLSVFSGAGDLTSLLTDACDIETFLHADIASARLPESGLCLAADEEAAPFAPESLDLFVSLLTLHTANDIVGALAQIQRALKPDGLFIAAVFGEATLTNLRQSLYQAETELTGGVSARIAPFAGVQDFGQALSRAGFALPVVDVDRVTVRYQQPLRLLHDLRGMGESYAMAAPRKALRRNVLMRAMEIFSDRGGEEQFDIVYLTGWAPHHSQQKPLKPGSGKASLEKAIKDPG